MNLNKLKQIRNFIIHNYENFKRKSYENSNLILVELFNFAKRLGSVTMDQLKFL